MRFTKGHRKAILYLVLIYALVFSGALLLHYARTWFSG